MWYSCSRRNMLSVLKTSRWYGQNTKDRKREATLQTNNKRLDDMFECKLHCTLDFMSWLDGHECSQRDRERKSRKWKWENVATCRKKLVINKYKHLFCKYGSSFQPEGFYHATLNIGDTIAVALQKKEAMLLTEKLFYRRAYILYYNWKNCKSCSYALVLLSQLLEQHACSKYDYQSASFVCDWSGWCAVEEMAQKSIRMLILFQLV